MWYRMWARGEGTIPKKANQLSALVVSKLKAEGRYAVSGADGLHLRIMGASRTWVLRVVFGSRKNADGKNKEHYFLLDGHLRLQALKELGVEAVTCLISTDDELFSYTMTSAGLPPFKSTR